MRIWIEASRPKTLIAAIAPVLLSSAWAAKQHSFHMGFFFVVLFAAVAIQIGTNFANDYFDHKKGADTTERLGPRRATQSGLVPPEAMKRAFVIAFSIAAVLGLYLIWQGGWPIALIGILSILLGVGYTAGPLPLAYKGLGDIFVFLFFGLISAAGTYYLYTGAVPLTVWFIGISCGALSTAILAVNNLRDRNEDSKTGKKTLAVRFGDTFTRLEYTLCLYIGFLSAPMAIGRHAKSQWGILGIILLGTLLARRLSRQVWQKDGGELNDLLAYTGQGYAVWTLLLAIVILFWI